MKSVTHQTTLHLSFKIKCCVDRLRPPGNLGNAGCPVLQVEGIGLDVIQAPKPEPRIMRYELTNVEWAECDARKERAPRAKRVRGVVAHRRGIISGSRLS